jgi:glycine cleavage system H lipoate-binding protein
MKLKAIEPVWLSELGETINPGQVFEMELDAAQSLIEIGAASEVKEPVKEVHETSSPVNGQVQEIDPLGQL